MAWWNVTAETTDSENDRQPTGHNSNCSAVEEFFLDSVVSVFARWVRVYSNEFALFGTCIFSIGQIEISKKSNSVRTRRLRSTKLSAIVRLGGPARHARFGATPPPVSPLEGVKDFFSIAIFSATAADGAAVLSALGAALVSLTSAPEIRGPRCQIWGRGSPNGNFTFFDPEIFCGP